MLLSYRYHVVTHPGFGRIDAHEVPTAHQLPTRPSAATCCGWWTGAMPGRAARPRWPRVQPTRTPWPQHLHAGPRCLWGWRAGWNGPQIALESRKWEKNTMALVIDRLFFLWRKALSIIRQVSIE
jgi:hypothetical protein